MATFKFKRRGQQEIEEFDEKLATETFHVNAINNLKNGHIAGYVFKLGALWISHK